ncbi:hypothetical protein [Corynebacterium heidelbergense]|uniref:Uncharacterized protein n=1 Tax=Corynebacterium heidelbergense TaxID=2055947 RepID=A0A364VC91_9CORY|nr:hypothetical protein [Corynebacterium heidelbergense]RAV34269.1 hypothetical protein CWC39_04250 [Corynebacterium heidelbergense]WCZ36958.1 hypothetical protein CHEID_07125 [Corynebacterium heidelbergense]
MDQVVALLPKGGGWSVVAVLLMLVFGSQQIFSKEGASRFWLFGRLADRIEHRKERSIAREATVQQARVDYLMTMVQDMRRDLDAERDRSRAAEEELRVDLDDAWGYVRYATDWSRTVLQMSAEHGWRPPLPEWLTPDQWRKRRHLPGGSD